jgi:hypothetical protein
MAIPFEELKIVLYCPACRKAYHHGDFREPCPNCGKLQWVCVFGAGQVVTAFEDQEALRLLIDNCDADEVKDVERIMGFKGGDCCSERTDNSRIIRLRKHFCEEDDER